MIAIALSCNPRVLIADEATTALDVTIQAQIIDLVKRLTEDLGTAVIWISHDLGVVAGICDTVAVMYAGTIVESGAGSRSLSPPEPRLHAGPARLHAASGRRRGAAAPAHRRTAAQPARSPPPLPLPSPLPARGRDLPREAAGLARRGGRSRAPGAGRISPPTGGPRADDGTRRPAGGVEPQGALSGREPLGEAPGRTTRYGPSTA